MIGERVKRRGLEALARVLARHARSDRVTAAAAKVQRLRTVVDEAMGAVWHFGAMPSRRDVRQLQRRVASLRRRVAELDLALAGLEGRVRARASDTAPIASAAGPGTGSAGTGSTGTASARADADEAATGSPATPGKP